jgi:hypothetical protein
LEAIIRCCGRNKCSKVSKKERTTPRNRSTETKRKTTHIKESLVLTTQEFPVSSKDMSTAQADELSAEASTVPLG